ncbi:DUF1028 domain-containing protein [Pelagivirga sediminicola]|uniref:DUF1028 domain-containing protein n=1 Tax=Pelagivirga sediminicola TaxID=2170575 RepID=A0A2T7G7Y2_9RHOB|nr:DUF1028 domain-containing protein [Pelagivirga sediminicola]PVA10542.1 DUF1028 domain-containing protein [Pelagivirga sediminicola]
MTFSLAGRCPNSGQIGYVVATSSVCVGARVGMVSDGVVIFSQARTDPRLHAAGLDAWRKAPGDARQALNAMKEHAVASHWRQLAVFPMAGAATHHTGASCLAHCGAQAGAHSLALGNFLGSDRVMPTMINTFENSDGPLAQRLLAAIRAGETAGSEREPLQSAALVVMGADDLKEVDLRVDFSTDPLADMGRLLEDWLPKAPAYRIRALDPDNAPSSADVEGRQT